ncbi:MAG: methylenetetrahydrofolate reductase [Clostridia bacterium]|nr:methylenetetrahydrofolate reductase [Clostridia bacterium]
MILDILKSKKVCLSCEVSPPKALTSLKDSKEIVGEISKLNPAYISVTCGAGGNQAVTDKTIEVAKQIENSGAVSLAHITCINASDESLNSMLDSLSANGVKNVLALRGDLPDGYTINEDAKYKHASDLVKMIKEKGGFTVGGACYPEGHIESKNREADIENLKIKVANGCDFLTTQMFFDNNILYSFMFRLLKNGIDIPVTAGIMPVVNAKQIERITSLSGTKLPPRFASIVDRFGDNPKSMRQAGIAYATEQIIDLISNGVNNIHLYTMNKPDIAESIISNLSDIVN